MEDNRLKLDAILRNIIGSNVYFQPPENIVMKYPCIRYELSSIDVKYADNLAYKYKKAYQITIIDRNPDSIFPDRMLTLPLCSFQRYYRSDSLNHFVFKIYY